MTRPIPLSVVPYQELRVLGGRISIVVQLTSSYREPTPPWLLGNPEMRAQERHMSSASQPQQLVSSNFINLIAYHAQEQATQPKQLCTTLTSQAAHERAQLQAQTPSQHLREHLR